jgi:hypothetical protein
MRACLLIAGIGVLAAACGRRSDNQPPVATPTISISRTRAALGSPIDVTYRFDVAHGTKIDGNYRVFVHFLDSEGERMWGDDHDPQPPTSQWQPGQKVEYTHLLWLPVYPYVGEARVRVGLYSGNRRLPLNGKEEGRREYEVATLTLLPPSENVFLIFKDGWHAAEVPADQQNVEWQWTRKVATLAFRNPRQDVLFFLETDGRPDVFKSPQQVNVVVNNQVVHTFAVDRKDPVLRRLPITAAQLGSEDMVDLKIQVDRTFTPAQIPAGSPGHSTDTRELGIRVFHAFIAPPKL